MEDIDDPLYGNMGGLEELVWFFFPSRMGDVDVVVMLFISSCKKNLSVDNSNELKETWNALHFMFMKETRSLC